MSHRVAANLVIGSDGSTTLKGSSAGLSFPADRIRFHQLRSEFQAILIGGNTARNEPYEKTPLPLIILTSQPLPPKIALNPLAEGWDLELPEAIAKATTRFGEILLEAGPRLLEAALKGGLVTDLYLTISHSRGGENPVVLGDLTRGWEEISREEASGGYFSHYRLAPSH
jgi:riboflavin biosynthesis pyrimidine reductase